MFLVGNFQHSLDDKNRIRLPSKYRDKLKTDDYLLMPGTNGCIFLFAEADYEQRMLKAIEDYESFDPEQAERVRRLTEFAATVTADSQGRFMLPPDLIAFAGIKKDVRIVGSLSKVEIWSEERYMARRNSQDNSPEAFNELFRDVHLKMQ